MPLTADTREVPRSDERLLVALDPLLGSQARGDIAAFIVEGRDIPVPAEILGPCFSVGMSDVPRWVLGFDEASFASKRAAAVTVDGPAYKAGLREDMPLTGWSVHSGDVTKEISLRVGNGDEAKQIRYVPVNGSRDSLPDVQVVEHASSPAWRSWIRSPR